MPWWKMWCHGCSMQVKLCKTLSMVRIGWEMRFLLASMKYLSYIMIRGPATLHFFQKLAVWEMRWCAMFEMVMPWLFCAASKTLKNFVKCQNRLGDEVLECYSYKIPILHHDLRPCNPWLLPEIGFVRNGMMPWWKMWCHGCSMQVKLCKTLWMVRIVWEMMFLHAIMKYKSRIMIWGPATLHFIKNWLSDKCL